MVIKFTIILARYTTHLLRRDCCRFRVCRSELNRVYIDCCIVLRKRSDVCRAHVSRH